jgi:transposase
LCIAAKFDVNSPLRADFVAKVILKRSRIVIHRGDAGILRDRTMMGRVNRDQGQLFYCSNLEKTVPEDHQVRRIAEVLDLSSVHADLASHYSPFGCPSIDPVPMIRMLIVGYVFAIRSERALCREVQVTLAYRWFCGLGIEDKVPDHSVFSRARNERFRDHDIFRQLFERFVARCNWARRR